ncbi:IrmA family protein [Achromobacter sp. JUb104]|uniref:IrmA family protein n=1 Tax=Achromobacter sp. JUb104 TaxID=2940590 RepID=UPI0021675364|nr:IrmA family protein [Achromobacter sp. JUb104]MCS3504479.1 hypothetical protein [Achromobacter sp. JUb104]
MQNEELGQITITHWDTLWANQGYYAAQILLDGGGLSGYRNLKVALDFLDSNGQKVDTGEFEIDELGTCTATRYATTTVESQKIGEEKMTVVIVSATAESELTPGKKIDLLALGLVSGRNPTSYEVRIR